MQPLIRLQQTTLWQQLKFS